MGVCRVCARPRSRAIGSTLQATRELAKRRPRGTRTRLGGEQPDTVAFLGFFHRALGLGDIHQRVIMQGTLVVRIQHKSHWNGSKGHRHIALCARARTFHPWPCATSTREHNWRCRRLRPRRRHGHSTCAISRGSSDGHRHRNDTPCQSHRAWRIRRAVIGEWRFT